MGNYSHRVPPSVTWRWVEENGSRSEEGILRRSTSCAPRASPRVPRERQALWRERQASPSPTAAGQCALLGGRAVTETAQAQAHPPNPSSPPKFGGRSILGVRLRGEGQHSIGGVRPEFIPSPAPCLLRHDAALSRVQRHPDGVARPSARSEARARREGFGCAKVQCESREIIWSSPAYFW